VIERTFTRFSKWATRMTGSPYAFVVAVLIIVAWALWAWPRGFDDSAQIVINTGTTIGTWLLLWLVQAAVNHETAAIKAQLAELVRAEPAARNELVNLDERSPEELEAIAADIAQEAKAPPPDEPSTWIG
jgi:low affinity Fe/Cu permease